MTTDSNAVDEASIRTMEARRFAAISAGDWDTFERCCDEALTYVHATAVVDTRASYLAKCRGGYYDYSELLQAVTKVLVLGDTALVWGTMRGGVTSGGVRKELNNRYLAAWLRRSGDWRLIASQPTVIPAQPAHAPAEQEDAPGAHLATGTPDAAPRATARREAATRP